MRYAYEAVIEHAEDGWDVRFPQLAEAYTFGGTREEAMRRAVEVLELTLAGRIDDGDRIPQPGHVAEVVTVSVDITDDLVAETRCCTVAQAAEDLGVSTGRVYQLLGSGGLEEYTARDGRRMVTIASVNARKADPPAPHRPRRERAAGPALATV